MKIEEKTLVLGNDRIAEEIYRLTVMAPRIARRARAGQFTMIEAGPHHDPFLRRPFSFARIHAESGRMEVIYKVTGRGTRLLSLQRPGSRLSWIGPLGNGFRLPTVTSRPVAIIAGGIGIASLLELLYALIRLHERAKERVHLYYGARTVSELIPLNDLQKEGIRVHVSTDDGSFGFHGTVMDLLEDSIREDAFHYDIVYACGTIPMLCAVARWAETQETTAQVSLEAHMACGFGVCLGCVVPSSPTPKNHPEPYLHVCTQGPVFDTGSIAWNKIEAIRPIPSDSKCNSVL